MSPDTKFMKKALALARLGRPSPNPKVGAVIVKGGKIIAQGYHKKRGLPHAEVVALGKIKDLQKLKKSTLYVTLEPCCHWGLTPPCTRAIIDSGLKKIKIAMIDPNMRVKGKGIRQLKKAGVKVELGLLKEEARQLNETYVKYITSGLPFVVLKWAMSLDGKIATRSGESRWISDAASRKYVHKLRSEFDTVLVGINTVLKDNPRLTSRIKNGRDPLRVIIDSFLKIPLKANVLKDDNVLIATTKNYNKKKKKILEKRGVKVLIAGEKEVSLKRLVKELGQLGLTSLLIEGGSQINASALKAKIVDKIILFLAPKIIGGKKTLSPVGGAGIWRMSQAQKIKKMTLKKIGQDILVEGYFQA